jgi:3-oxoacyl-[acyl-carrier-protein] synthase II
MITGIGLVSCLGEGTEAHWAALNRDGGFRPVVDTTTFAPWPVHPMTALELDRQIPKRGDQRQMEAWQRTGTYASGLALDSAGVKGNADLLSRMEMIVAPAAASATTRRMRHPVSAAQCGRSALPSTNTCCPICGRRTVPQLSTCWRNVSIVHGVVGSSRTFMGEESSGTDAVRIACARIAAGQGELFLVGGSYNAQRPDVLLHYEMGGLLWQWPFVGVWSRLEHGGGMVLGSVGCFLVVESREHAAARGGTALAHIAAVATDRCRRRPGEALTNATHQLMTMRHHLEPPFAAVISGASGAPEPTREEAAFLRDLGMPMRATASAFGHSLEPSFPANLALAALSLSQRRLFAPLEPDEQPMTYELRHVLVTSWGH